MTTAILDALNSLAQDMDIQVLPKPSSQFVFDLRFLRPPTARNVPLKIGVSNEITTVENRPIDLLFVSRAVRFDEATDLPLSPDPIDLSNLGPLPVLPSLPTEPVPIGEPGNIGRITGAIPVAVTSLETIEHAVTIELRWEILDENQEPLTSSESFGWKIGNDLSGQGGHIEPPSDRITQVVELTLIPPFVDLVPGIVPVGRWVQARFRLKAAGVSTAWFELRQKIELPALGIPTLAFLFRDKLQGAPVLVMIPSNSLLGEDTFMDVLVEVTSALEQLRSILGFLGLFIDRVNDIAAVLEGASVKVKKADGISDLNNVDLIHHPNWPNISNIPVNDTEAEDEISSLVFFGPPHRRLQCYNAPGFSDSEGEMHVTSGREMVVVINDLHSASPGGIPNNVTVLKAPTGCRGWRCYIGLGHDITTFGDEFSSVRFD